MIESRNRLVARLGRARRRLAQRVLPSDSTSFAAALGLDSRHLDGCVLLPNREMMIQECLPKDGVVAEIGTFTGDNAVRILEGTRPRELHLIDIDLSRLRREIVDRGIRDGTVRLHQTDSVVALRAFPDAYFDWLYIDGDHSYDGAKRDIQQAKRTVKPDGLLVFNDYIFYSHNELAPYGVVQAVNELCVNEGWGLRYFALQAEMYCDVALARLGQ